MPQYDQIPHAHGEIYIHPSEKMDGLNRRQAEIRAFGRSASEGLAHGYG
jgi:hypothetical protein